MISIYYQAPVNADRMSLWQCLTEMVEEPGKYIPDVESVAFKPWRGGMLLREMKRAEISMQEVIQINESRGLVRYELKDHPQYKGYSEATITEEEGQVYIATELQWESTSGEEDFEKVNSWFKRTIKAIKANAEKK